MGNVFRTPATQELPRTLPGCRRDRFWSRVRAEYVGSAVLKAHDGSYVTVAVPTPAQVRGAATVYWGGYVYEVDDDEATALEAAGYTITEE